MDREIEIFRKLEQILKENCNVAGIVVTREQSLQEDLDLDSLGLLALAVEVENFYQIHLEEDPSDPPRTVGELAQLIAQRLTEAGKE